MDRSAWLKKQRLITEDHEDRIYASIYDENWGDIDPIHEQFFNRFLSLCPPDCHILDAACGTGKYWSLILASGRTVYGIDQSQGMLAQASKKFSDVACDKVGLQEMSFHEEFDGAVCLDAMEFIPPEDWPLVLSNFHAAIKPEGYFYFTVEVTSQEEIEKAFRDARRLGAPVVYGEWAYESGFHGDWAQEGAYHYYPKIEQVKDWIREAGFKFIAETEEEEYHHFLVQSATDPDGVPNE